MSVGQSRLVPEQYSARSQGSVVLFLRHSTAGPSSGLGGQTGLVPPKHLAGPSQSALASSHTTSFALYWGTQAESMVSSAQVDGRAHVGSDGASAHTVPLPSGWRAHAPSLHTRLAQGLLAGTGSQSVSGSRHRGASSIPLQAAALMSTAISHTPEEDAQFSLPKPPQQGLSLPFVQVVLSPSNCAAG